MLHKMDNYFYSGWQFLFLLHSELISYHISPFHLSKNPRMNGSFGFVFCLQKVAVIVLFQRFKGANILKHFSLIFHAYNLGKGLRLLQISYSMLLFWHFTTLINERWCIFQFQWCSGGNTYRMCFILNTLIPWKLFPSNCLNFSIDSTIENITIINQRNQRIFIRSLL